MKSLLAAAALGSRLGLAHPPLSFPFYGGGNSSSVAAGLLGTGSVNCTHSVANATSVAAVLTFKDSSTTPCGCSTAVTTTTVYVPEPETASSIAGPLSTSSTSETTSTSSGDTYFFSMVNGTTAWSNGIAPPADLGTTVYSTSTAYVIPIPVDVTSTDVTLTVTNQRTLTSTATSGWISRTSTIVVTETLVTTIHVSLPSSSVATVPTSAAVGGIMGSATSSTTVTVPSTSSTPTSEYGETSSVVEGSAGSDAISSTVGPSSSTLDSPVTISSSSESDATVFITSSHTVTLTSSSSTKPTSSETSSTSAFPSLSPSGAEGITFSAVSAGTTIQGTGTAGTDSAGTTQSSPALVSSSSCTTHVVGNTTFSEAGVETSSSYGLPPFANATTVGPIATQSSSYANYTEAHMSTISLSWTSSSYVASWTPETSLVTALPSSSSNVSSTLNITLSSPVGTQTSNSMLPSSDISTSLTSSLPTPSVISISNGPPFVNSTEAGGIATESTSGSSSISIFSGFPPVVASSSSTFSTSVTTSPAGYGQTPPFPTSSSGANASANCGEIGDFVMNWDDEPLYEQVKPNDPPYAPVFNPYHHLFFAQGFSYYDPVHSISKPEPYDPISGPNVAIFHVNGNTALSSADRKDDFDMLPGTIGAGPRANNMIYWFNAYSAELGCDNGGSAPCNMAISGYVWSNSTNQEEKAVTQTAMIQPCNQLEDCTLQHVALDGFKGLSSIRFEAIVDGSLLKSWVIDNLSMGWFDNSCDAGRARSSHKR